MSAKQAKAFVKKFRTDHEFHRMIMKGRKNGRIKKIVEEGFDCTVEELRTEWSKSFEGKWTPVIGYPDI